MSRCEQCGSDNPGGRLCGACYSRAQWRVWDVTVAIPKPDGGNEIRTITLNGRQTRDSAERQAVQVAREFAYGPRGVSPIRVEARGLSRDDAIRLGYLTERQIVRAKLDLARYGMPVSRISR